MKMVKLKTWGDLTVAVAFVATIASCRAEDPIKMTGASPTVEVRNPSTGIQPEIRRSDDGKTFIRSDGWPIPDFGEAEREEFVTSITTAEGRSVQVGRTVIDPLSLYTENPLYLIDIGAEKIRINKVKEYRTSAGIFCYRFLANDAVVDESTNKLRTRGFLYSYSYYDENGDGVFESLVISEKDRHGWKGFQNEPHLPAWSIAKIDDRSTPRGTSTQYS
jgi:hypothetical protein